MDGADPLRPEPVAGIDGRRELRRAPRPGVVAEGTLACPACDAPVTLAVGPVAVTTPLACPYCDRRGRVREFLSLAMPTRPARVVVRIAMRPRPRPAPVAE